MKIFKLFFFAAVLLMMTACGNDDDGGPSQTELNIANLAGTYNITFLEGSSELSVTTGSGNTIVAETETYSGDTFTNAILVLNAAGTYSISGSYVETYTVTVTGESPVTDEEIVIFNESGSFSLNGSERTITFDGDEVNNVTLFDGTNLRLTSEYIDVDGTETETGETEIRLVKQN